ncbi:hypothetical protein VTN00DRAFT_1793 [Thermoascus crustaceus]|uniref:uncharacterized protein n=1 Tax=Thermoascus crustaceus TaxID=5088 RepID=UPI0037436DA2
MCSAAQRNPPTNDRRRVLEQGGRNSTRQASIAETSADDREKSAVADCPKQAIVKLFAAKAALEASRAGNGTQTALLVRKGRSAGLHGQPHLARPRKNHL